MEKESNRETLNNQPVNPVDTDTNGAGANNTPVLNEGAETTSSTSLSAGVIKNKLSSKVKLFTLLAFVSAVIVPALVFILVFIPKYGDISNERVLADWERYLSDTTEHDFEMSEAPVKTVHDNITKFDMLVKSDEEYLVFSREQSLEYKKRFGFLWLLDNYEKGDISSELVGGPNEKNILADIESQPLPFPGHGTRTNIEIGDVVLDNKNFTCTVEASYKYDTEWAIANVQYDAKYSFTENNWKLESANNNELISKYAVKAEKAASPINNAEIRRLLDSYSSVQLGNSRMTYNKQATEATQTLEFTADHSEYTLGKYEMSIKFAYDINNSKWIKQDQSITNIEYQIKDIEFSARDALAIIDGGRLTLGISGPKGNTAVLVLADYPRTISNVTETEGAIGFHLDITDVPSPDDDNIIVDLHLETLQLTFDKNTGEWSVADTSNRYIVDSRNVLTEARMRRFADTSNSLECTRYVRLVSKKGSFTGPSPASNMVDITVVPLSETNFNITFVFSGLRGYDDVFSTWGELENDGRITIDDVTFKNGGSIPTVDETISFENFVFHDGEFYVTGNIRFGQTYYDSLLKKDVYKEEYTELIAVRRNT